MAEHARILVPEPATIPREDAVSVQPKTERMTAQYSLPVSVAESPELVAEKTTRSRPDKTTDHRVFQHAANVQINVV